jgi:chromosome segregation ATPase
MSNGQESGNKNEYFEYVENRIDKLEKLILQKDEELKSLIVKATQNEGNDTGLHRKEDEVLVKRHDNFERAFKDIKQEEERFMENTEKRTSYEAEDLNRQLSNIEQREKMVQEMLDSLGTALKILKQRHEEVNRKEETLNREYQKLQEIEAMYWNTEPLDLSRDLETQKKGTSLDFGEMRKTPEKFGHKE